MNNKGFAPLLALVLWGGAELLLLIGLHHEWKKEVKQQQAEENRYQSKVNPNTGPYKITGENK